MESHCVLCEVDAESLYHYPLTEPYRVAGLSILGHSIIGFVVGKVALGPSFLPVLLFPPVSVIPPTLHTDLQLHVAITRRTNGRSLELSNRTVLFRETGSIGQRSDLTAYRMDHLAFTDSEVEAHQVQCCRGFIKRRVKSV
jgi:hypothetical protein